MDRYNITGMSCAACSARVEKAVKAVDGVTECSVNLLTNSMTVKGSATTDTIIEAVQKAGYGAELQGAKSKDKKPVDSEKKEIKVLIKRLIASVAVLLVLMYFCFV